MLNLQLGGSLLGGGFGGASSAAAPDAVGDLAATSAPSSAVLAWSAPPNNGSEITDYIVQYQPT